MLGKTTVIFAALLASSLPAAAQEMCGDLPIAPEISGAPDMRTKPPPQALAAMRGAYSDMRRWQGDLKSYRDCLTASINTDSRDLSEAQHSDKPDKDKIAKLQASLGTVNQMWNASVDSEERVVNEFHAAQTAYCTRKDVDTAICPKT